MSEIVTIQSPLSYLRGILFGTNSSDPTKGETVDVTSGAAHVRINDEAGADFSKDVKKTVVGADEYKVLIAATANQTCGAVGAVGDYLDEVVLAVTAAGSVVILDNATTIMTIVYTGAVNGPSVIPVRKRSLTGAWKITTPAGITGIAGGIFA